MSGDEEVKLSTCRLNYCPYIEKLKKSTQ
jgi:hypothetical protein